MPKAKGSRSRSPFDEAAFVGKRRAPVPHEFVLEALAAVAPTTRPMFGCLAVYVDDRIVLILRDRQSAPADNGVWLATTSEHHASLQRHFPHMRSIRLLGKRVTGYQVLAVDSPDFERAALAACALILARDPRIGKIPQRRLRSVKSRPGKSSR